jgi:hypothetical protein
MVFMDSLFGGRLVKWFGSLVILWSFMPDGAQLWQGRIQIE